MRKKRFSIRALVLTAVLTVVLTAAVILGVLVLLLGQTGVGMAEALLLINTQFVGEHDITEATDAAMDTLITRLGDRWSYYMDAEGYARQRESKNNAYVGIGATVSYPEGEGLYVEAVAKDGPSDKAGLQAGDLILAVDGVHMSGGDRQKGTQMARGPVGSEVVLTVRFGDGTQGEVTVVRGTVEEHPVSYQLLEGGTGLVTIENFNRRCAEEAIAAVDDLAEQGAQRLVFDVRDNGGGYVDELNKLLDHLLPKGVIFRSANKAEHQDSVRSDADCVELPMAILVNGNTYSAAEFFAAQLQEMDWGIIVGEPTFGKGFSQQTFPLLSGGAINISTAKYYTGNGVSLIGVGLTLDREVTLNEEQAKKLANQILPPEEDPQLQTAIQMLLQ